MTEPRTLTKAELLAWSVVLAYRAQRERDGITILLPNYPPCPVCRSSVDEAGQEHTYSTFVGPTVTLHLAPCGHAVTASYGQLKAIYVHQQDMLDDLEARELSTEGIIADAARRIGEEPPGPVVGHATIGINVAAAQATDSIEAIRDRVRAVVTELRAQVAEHEHNGKLPMDHPMALWCDTVSNIASQIEYALRAPAPARGIPCDGPTIREAAADDRRWPLEQEGE